MCKLEYLIGRSVKIEGGDIGAILGIDKYKSIASVYKERTMEIQSSSKAVESIYWINTLNEVVSKEFMLRTRKKVRKNNINSTDKDYEFMASNVNHKVIGENSILDCKVLNKFDSNDIWSTEVPEKYLLQAQHDMRVKKADKCYIAILINGEKFVLYEVERDDILISKIVKVEEEFWKNFIEKKVEPVEPLNLDKI